MGEEEKVLWAVQRFNVTRNIWSVVYKRGGNIAAYEDFNTAKRGLAHLRYGNNQYRIVKYVEVEPKPVEDDD